MVDLLNFAGTAAAGTTQVLLLVIELKRSSRVQYNRAYEHKFRALRWARTLTYAALCVCQVRMISRAAEGDVSMLDSHSRMPGPRILDV